MVQQNPFSGVPRRESSKELLRLAAAARTDESTAAPRAPQDCGDFDIRIARDGTWFHEGRPIRRPALVRLFSTVLRREGGDYFLVTPAERGRITVEDAPFLGVALSREGEGSAQILTLRTNVDDEVRIDRAHPLRIETVARDEPRPYVLIRDGLEARLLRPVFYELVDLGCEERVGDTTLYGVWSTGVFFPLGPVEAA